MSEVTYNNSTDWADLYDSIGTDEDGNYTGTGGSSSDTSPTSGSTTTTTSTNTDDDGNSTLDDAVEYGPSPAPGRDPTETDDDSVVDTDDDGVAEGGFTDDGSVVWNPNEDVGDTTDAEDRSGSSGGNSGGDSSDSGGGETEVPSPPSQDEPDESTEPSDSSSDDESGSSATPPYQSLPSFGGRQMAGVPMQTVLIGLGVLGVGYVALGGD